MANISNNQAKAVYISVAVLGGLASVFGIAGSFIGNRQRGGTFKYAPGYSYCTWPTSPAAGLGIAGFFLILAAQITSNACGGCVCCSPNQTPTIVLARKACAIICLVFSWILTVFGSLFLLDGGLLNLGAIHMKPEVYNVGGGGACDYPATWPLLVGGVLSLLATGLSLVFFYIVVNNSSSSSDDLNNINGGITTSTGYPPSYNVQMPTVITTNAAKTNDAEFIPPPPAAAAAIFGSHAETYIAR